VTASRAKQGATRHDILESRAPQQRKGVRDMVEQWMTVAEAAAYLRVHPRTIERRLAAGKLASGRAEDGQVVVRIEVPDEPEADGAPDNDVNDAAFEAVKELADRQVDIAAGSASAIVRMTQELAERATQDLAICKTELQVARKSSRVAWITVGLLGGTLTAALMGTITWSGRTLADERANVRVLGEKLQEVRQDKQALARDLGAERDTARRAELAARQDLEDVKLARAKIEGELAVYARQADARPASATTRPASVIQRIAAALAEPE
jgi:excisionase family DNA binding protein